MVTITQSPKQETISKAIDSFIPQDKGDEMFVQILKTSLTHHDTLFAMDNDNVLAALSFWHNTPNKLTAINYMAVKKDHRGKHIGAQLLTSIKEEAHKLGNTTIEADCLPESLHFFLAMGFQPKKWPLRIPLQWRHTFTYTLQL